MIHELKIKPEYFAAVVSGDKTFEIRNNADRNFQVGDTLLLWEWDEGFTSQTAERTVSYITDFEQKPGYVVLGLASKREQELSEQLADATRQCGVMADLLREAIGEVPQTQSFPSRCDAALAGKMPDRQGTEWTDSATSPVAADYRELQGQHDQLQSKYKGALDLLHELREGAEIHLHNCKVCKNEEGVNSWTGKLASIDAALAGKFPPPAWYLDGAKDFKSMMLDASTALFHPHIEGVFAVFERRLALDDQPQGGEPCDSASPSSSPA